MVRPGGRRLSESRSVTAKIENLDRVDASARFGFGNTTAIASISGPIEAKLGSELPSKAALEITLRPLHGIAGVTEKSLVSILRSVFTSAILLNAHPRSLIQIVFQLLSSSSLGVRYRAAGSHMVDESLSVAAALINAGSLAFLQASSIPLTGVIIAVSIGVKEENGSRNLLVDPEESETSSLVGCGVFAFLFFQSRQRQSNGERGIEGKVVWSQWNGDLEMTEVSRAEKLARQKGLEILQLFRRIMSGEDIDSSMALD